MKITKQVSTPAPRPLQDRCRDGDGLRTYRSDESTHKARVSAHDYSPPAVLSVFMLFVRKHVRQRNTFK